MKKTIGIILLVISSLNIVSIFVHLSNSESIGSPIYLILIAMMFFGGLGLINSKKRKNDETTLSKNQND